MSNGKWLLKEIDLWETESLISPETAAILKERYASKKNINMPVIIFSIIGSLLIGTGIILIIAKNWYFLPMFARVALAFAPLVISQALSVHTVLKKYSSAAWRESTAILTTASVFAAIAIVGQVFHLAGDYGTYILVCGLLSFPMIYILNAASPLVIYYWTILNWAALDRTALSAVVLPMLFSAGAAFVFYRKRLDNKNVTYAANVTIIAGFVLVMVLGGILHSSLLLLTLCYFILLITVPYFPAHFKSAAVAGSLVVLAAFTYEDAWKYIIEPIGTGTSLLAGSMIAASSFYTFKIFKQDKLKCAFWLSLLVMAAVRCIFAVSELNMPRYSLFFAIVSNVHLLCVGVGFLIYGVKRANLPNVNVGMASICVFTAMRFFDSGLDFFWRGVVFLMLGCAFLLVNAKMIKSLSNKKKQAEVENE